MANPPETSPLVAYAPTAVVEEPSTQTKGNWWISGAPPPPEHENWWSNLVGQWLDFFALTVGTYSDLAIATTRTPVGGRCLVFEDDLSAGPGAEEVEKDTGITVSNGLRENLALTGDAVIYGAGDNDPVRVNRDLDELQSGGSPLTTYARTNSGDIQRIITDGTYVIAMYGPLRYVECWLIDGTPVWVKDAGSNSLADLCMRNGVVYVVGGALAATDFTTGKNVWALDATSGAENWSYQNTGDNQLLAAVATNGRQVFIAGPISTFVSGATQRALRASDGFDLANEGGTGQDFSGLAWDLASSNIVSAGGLDCDGQYLYQANTVGSAAQAQARDASEGASSWAVASPAGMTGVSVAVDQDYVYIAYSDLGSPAEGFIKAHDRRNGRAAWRFLVTDKTAGTAGSGFSTVVSDGQKVYAVAEDEPLVWRVSRGNKGADAFQRVDLADFNGGIRNLALQPERSI